MADHLLPTVGSSYVSFLASLMARDDDNMRMGRSDTVTLTNPPTGTIRYNATSKLWQENTGTPAAPVWGSLTINAAGITQDASNRFITDAERTAWNAKAGGGGTATGTNTGDNAANSSTHYIGTTAIALNRASAAQTLEGIALGSGQLMGSFTVPAADVNWYRVATLDGNNLPQNCMFQFSTANHLNIQVELAKGAGGDVVTMEVKVLGNYVYWSTYPYEIRVVPTGTNSPTHVDIRLTGGGGNTFHVYKFLDFTRGGVLSFPMATLGNTTATGTSVQLFDASSCLRRYAYVNNGYTTITYKHGGGIEVGGITNAGATSTVGLTNTGYTYLRAMGANEWQIQFQDSAGTLKGYLGASTASSLKVLNAAASMWTLTVDQSGNGVFGGTVAGTNITTGGNTTGTSNAVNGKVFSAGSTANFNTDFQNTEVSGSRFHADTSTATNNPGGAWWFHKSFRHSNASNYWGTQYAYGWEDNANRMMVRNIQGGAFGVWHEFISTACVAREAAGGTCRSGYTYVIYSPALAASGMYLPANPALGASVRFIDMYGQWGTNSWTVYRNGQPIMSLAEDMTINTANANFTLVYGDTACGWRVVNG